MPSNTSGPLRVAEDYLVRGKVEEAIGIYRNISDANPANLNLKDRLAELLVLGKKGREAIRVFSDIARAHVRMGQYAEALSALKKVLKLDPSNAGVLMDMGRLCSEIGLTGEAERYYLQAAEIYSRKGEAQKLEAACQSAASVAPNNAELQIKYGALSHRSGKLDQSYAAFMKAAAEFKRRGDEDAALDAYGKALKVAPSNTEAGNTVAEVMRQLGLQDEGRHQERASVRTQPVIAPQLVSKVDQNRVTNSPEPASDPDPDTSTDDLVVGKISKAEILFGFGRLDQAVALLAELAEVRPEDTRVYKKLKDIYLRSEMPQQAAEVYEHLARLYESQGDAEGAAECRASARRLTGVPGKPGRPPVTSVPRPSGKLSAPRAVVTQVLPDARVPGLAGQPSLSGFASASAPTPALAAALAQAERPGRHEGGQSAAPVPALNVDAPSLPVPAVRTPAGEGLLSTAVPPTTALRTASTPVPVTPVAPSDLAHLESIATNDGDVDPLGSLFAEGGDTPDPTETNGATKLARAYSEVRPSSITAEPKPSDESERGTPRDTLATPPRPLISSPVATEPKDSSFQIGAGRSQADAPSALYSQIPLKPLSDSTADSTAGSIEDAAADFSDTHETAAGLARAGGQAVSIGVAEPATERTAAAAPARKAHPVARQHRSAAHVIHEKQAGSRGMYYGAAALLLIACCSLGGYFIYRKGHGAHASAPPLAAQASVASQVPLEPAAAATDEITVSANPTQDAAAQSPSSVADRQAEKDQKDQRDSRADKDRKQNQPSNPPVATPAIARSPLPQISPRSVPATPPAVRSVASGVNRPVDQRIPTPTGTFTGGMPAAPPPPVPAAPVVKSTGTTGGETTKRVQPSYPATARAMHMSGSVTVEVSINEQGSVVSARAVSGPPVFAFAAESAARGFRFKPTLLDGKPIKTSRTLVFHFKD